MKTTLTAKQEFCNKYEAYFNALGLENTGIAKPFVVEQCYDVIVRLL